MKILFFVVQSKLVLLIIITVLPSFLSGSSITLNENTDNIANYTNSFIDEPLRFWRASSEFKILESKIFPMASLGVGGVINKLGKAWITWILELDGAKVPAYAVFDQGVIKDFVIGPGSFYEVYFQAASDNLILITSTNDTTAFTLHTYGKRPIQSSLRFNSTGHQIFFFNDGFQAFLYENGTVPTLVYVEGYALVSEETDLILQSSIPNAALYRTEEDTYVFVDNEETYILPSSFSKNSTVGHIFLTPAVFDIENKQFWINEQTFSLPDNISDIYTFGLKSSIIKTNNNSLYELGLNNWELIKKYDTEIEIEDYSIIDIGLYIGSEHKNGLQMHTFGPDEDGDFSPDTMESYYGSYPFTSDTDLDSIPDNIEIAFGLNPLYDDRNIDYDLDYMNTIDELNLGLDPKLSDYDFGGALDGWEIEYNFDPFNSTDDFLDNDNDGVPNYEESIWRSSPFSSDTDLDKIPDSWEIRYGLDPTDPSNAALDIDGDGRDNLYEYLHGTDPLIPDPKRIFSGMGYWIIFSVIVTIPITMKLKKHLDL